MSPILLPMPAISRSVFLAAIAAATVGCGGSGTTATSTTLVPTATPVVAQRAHVGGDTFNYATTGTYSKTPLTAIAAASGATVVTYLADAYGGQSALEKTDTTNLTVDGDPVTLTDSVQYSANGLVLGATDDGSVVAVSSGGFVEAPSLAPSTKVVGEETLADGTTVSLNYAVTGTASITTSAGTFSCTVFTRSVVYSDKSSSISTVYFAPSIGASAKEIVQNKYADGASDSLTLELASYSLGKALTPIG
jgi:hypothetical protein